MQNLAAQQSLGNPWASSAALTRLRRSAGRTLELSLGTTWTSGRAKRRHVRARRAFERFMRETAGGFFVPVDPGPPWTRELLLRTGVMDESQIPTLLDPDHFFGRGYEKILHLLSHAHRCGFNFRTAGGVLELGCGSGRLLRHLRCVEGLKLVGTDVIADSIDWCRANVPGIEFHSNELSPPLAFAEDASFDLVFAASVFTHIPFETQAAWIEELSRVLRPGGYAAVTVHGSTHAGLMLDSAARAQLAREGHYTLTGDDPRASVSTRHIDSWDVFQTRPEVIRAFGKVFDLLDYVPGGQDLLILRRPLDGSPGASRYVIP